MARWFCPGAWTSSVRWDERPKTAAWCSRRSPAMTVEITPPHDVSSPSGESPRPRGGPRLEWNGPLSSSLRRRTAASSRTRSTFSATPDASSKISPCPTVRTGQYSPSSSVVRVARSSSPTSRTDGHAESVRALERNVVLLPARRGRRHATTAGSSRLERHARPARDSLDGRQRRLADALGGLGHFGRSCRAPLALTGTVPRLPRRDKNCV